ncbi:MAG TPA: iron uptake porin [Thermosynechococcaceae cyanobacterium]
MRRFIPALSLASLVFLTAGEAKALDFLIRESEVPRSSSNTSINASDSMSEINSVSQLSDVRSSDWAFQALQSLIERYSCLKSYPDQTFRGNHTLTRHEFAAGLSGCLDRISELMTAGTTDSVTKSDLATLQKLQAEFATELAILRGRVNTLETRTTQLETTQFSTTTKLAGEVIYGLTGSFGSKKAATAGSNQSDPLDESVILSDRIRLRLNTSFTGQDFLRIRLQAGNMPSLGQATGTNMARLGFDGNNENQFEVNQLFYRFPIGQSAEVTILASGALFDVADILNPFLGSDSVGSPFLFGVRSPIYREELGGTGAGISYDLSPVLNLTLVYLATDANQPASGLFKGSFSALGQLTWKPNDRVDIGLLYSRSYNGIEINAGSNNANTPFGTASQSVSANSYGLVANARISSKFAIGGWTGFVQATANDLPGNPTADIFYYAVTLAFPDLGKKGNLAGIAFGQPPKLVRNEFGIDDPNTSFNIQAFYRFQINDYISTTPGLLVITNPEHNRNNDTLYIGTIRTTFTF